MSDYPSFRAFMEQYVLPRRKEHPWHVRLDGQDSGGNRSTAGSFWRAGRQWRVHADTCYEPLLVAYDALDNSDLTDPFIEAATKRGGAACLVLRPELQEGSGSKRLYIYEIKQAG